MRQVVNSYDQNLGVPGTPAHAKIIVGGPVLFSLVGPQTDKTLISIDPNTASTSVIGKVGGGHDLEGLAYNPDDGFLYGSTGWKNPGGPALIRINPSTGTSETVGLYTTSRGEPNEIDALSFYPITGVLYSINEGGPPSGGQLCTVDITTGRATIIGDLGDSFGGGDPGIAFDSTGTLYGVSKASDQLFTIDITTGTATGIGPLGFDNAVGLDFNPDTGVLFGIDIQSSELITLDTTTGEGTLVGVLTGSVTELPVALAFMPALGNPPSAPEGLIALLLSLTIIVATIVAVSFAVLRKRRKQSQERSAKRTRISYSSVVDVLNF